jgi:16S rRNA (guanine(527)-N(7))-methyltransferase GidB
MLFNDYPEMNVFEEGLMEFGIQLTDVQKQQFIDYYELLIEKNKVMNLTAITEFQEVVTKHFIDSISLVKVCDLKNQKLLDLGTGAGFPGIPLKIVFPDLDIVLLDSLNKRILFLNEVIQKLNLKNIIAIHGRAEDIGKDKKYREQFDLCVSRAVAKLSSLSEYCVPFVKKEGFFIPYKSGKVEEELIESAKAIKTLGTKLEDVKAFKLPGTDIERTLVVLKKCLNTPSKYPRSAGKPSKEPL